jgi:uncharacterized protein (DUF1697 family)
MNNFCAFLRGVNVKGTNMKMAEVCQVFEEAGMQKVSSVLASGNILFRSDRDAVAIKKILEEAMSTHFSYEAFLFIRDEKEINSIFNNDPFQPIENFHNYIFIGTGKVEELLLEEFQKADKEEGEQGQIIDNVFYWQVPKGQTLNSTFGKILGRKNLKDQMTSRNSNTFEKIIRKFS